nr:MAG TPA: Cytosine specific methyltransferase [Caudoviricetes sp.]
MDCITFGSPCQDLSIAGRRAGLAGGRSGLFVEAVRIIKEMRKATNGMRRSQKKSPARWTRCTMHRRLQ